MSEDYIWLEGVPLSRKYLTSKYQTGEWRNFMFKEDDILTVSYPKSGTHWMIEILSLIQNKGDPKWVQSVPIWDRSPWLEARRLYEALEAKEGPRLITSHLPIQLLPKSLFTSKAKIIHLIRDPRDVLVSGYFFSKICFYFHQSASLQAHFECFMQGNVCYGSWFEHTRGWMSMKGKENYLLLSYEELKRDTRSTIEKICQFLGKNLEPEEINSVLKHSSFQAMRDNKMTNYTILDDAYFNLNNGPFLRKGISGDWRNHLTVAQAEAFDRAFQEKMVDLPPELFPWE
ncbi:sulfotransferase 2A1-like [Erinaceus europaeus]|uniref:Sulfotransferase n=1 Tax=Erinaceus europaeus TaxID=9365 RepID=A0ABM3VXS6_ERIEU|nr:sulfotransferase 2A1-like [Erinaceus europaeus]XP_060029102.1 sulfotransferase 2A1-like [Erinaceus europaeus]